MVEIILCYRCKTELRYNNGYWVDIDGESDCPNTPIRERIHWPVTMNDMRM